jgi:hypothetical protein
VQELLGLEDPGLGAAGPGAVSELVADATVGQKGQVLTRRSFAEVGEELLQRAQASWLI